jgi:protein TonB
MKRLLIPFTVAILLHVLLLRIHGDGVSKKGFEARSAPIALALTYVKKEALPLPAPPPHREETPEKVQASEKPQEIPVVKPPAPKPEPVKLTPKKVQNKTREPDRKATVVPTPRPEPSPQTSPAVEKPIPPSDQKVETGPPVPNSASPRQTLDDSSPPNRDLNPDGDRRLATLPPLKALKEAVPIYRQNPPPGYPRIARRKGYEGTVVLEVLVGREGRVSDLRLLHSCGHAVLDEAAADSVRSWLFDPGTLDNDPVEMWVKVPVRFQLKE